MKKVQLFSRPSILVFAFILVWLIMIPIIAFNSSLNRAPIIESTPTTDIKEGITYIYKVAATDLDNDTLEYSLSIFPEGMKIGPYTGLITWIPTSSGKFDVAVQVSDKEKSTIQTFSITVEKALLISIKVLPSPFMYLNFNELRSITSVTAYYDNGKSKNIELANCSYNSNNPDVATVDASGNITGISNRFSMPAIITVSYTEDNITKTKELIVITNAPTFNFNITSGNQPCPF
jgi:hypothetical protein